MDCDEVWAEEGEKDECEGGGERRGESGGKEGGWHFIYSTCWYGISCSN